MPNGSWPAFLATFAWLRAHGRHAWAWSYYFVSTPILLAVFVVWQTAGNDACLRALSAPNPVPIAIVCAIGAGWLLPPLFASRLVDPQIAPERGYWGALFLQLLPLALVVIWAPSYGNYITRAKVSEGVSLAAGLKAPLAQHLADRGSLPARAQELGAPVKGRYVREVTLAPDGTIRAVFGDETQALAGRSIQLRPRIEGRTVVEWTCRSEDLPAACLPGACRQ